MESHGISAPARAPHAGFRNGRNVAEGAGNGAERARTDTPPPQCRPGVAGFSDRWGWVSESAGGSGVAPRVRPRRPGLAPGPRQGPRDGEAPAQGRGGHAVERAVEWPLASIQDDIRAGRVEPERSGAAQEGAFEEGGGVSHRRDRVSGDRTGGGCPIVRNDRSARKSGVEPHGTLATNACICKGTDAR